MKKYITAILYAAETPVGVWAGFEFGSSNMIEGVILTIAMVVMEILAVITWMDAQSSQTADEIVKRQKKEEEK